MISRTIILLLVIPSLFACQKRDGCTDPVANNYIKSAENDDGSCRYDNELFNGSWKVRDTIISGKTFKEGDEKMLTVFSDIDNKSEVKLIWKTQGASKSDTVIAKLVPLALSIPLQKFGNNKTIRGNIIYVFYSNDPVKKIRLSYVILDQTGNSVEIRGTGEKLP